MVTGRRASSHILRFGNYVLGSVGISSIVIISLGEEGAVRLCGSLRVCLYFKASHFITLPIRARVELCSP